MLRLALALSLGLVLTLAGCSPGPAADPVAPEASPAISTAPSVARTESVRGNLVKRFGEPAYTGCPPGATDPDTCTVVFTLDRIERCGALPGSRVLWWTITTRPTFGEREQSLISFDPSGLTLVDSAGVSRQVFVGGTPGDGCVAERDRLIWGRAMQPATTYRGAVQVELPGESGVLVFAPPWVDGAGWEWVIT